MSEERKRLLDDQRTKQAALDAQLAEQKALLAKFGDKNLSAEDKKQTMTQLKQLGDQIKVRMQTFGTSPTTIRAKVWWGTAAEPSSWTVTATSSYAGLQRTGAVGLTTYLSGTTTNAPLNVSMLSIVAKPVTP